MGKFKCWICQKLKKNSLTAGDYGDNILTTKSYKEMGDISWWRISKSIYIIVGQNLVSEIQGLNSSKFSTFVEIIKIKTFGRLHFKYTSILIMGLMYGPGTQAPLGASWCEAFFTWAH